MVSEEPLAKAACQVEEVGMDLCQTSRFPLFAFSQLLCETSEGFSQWVMAAGQNRLSSRGLRGSYKPSWRWLG